VVVQRCGIALNFCQIGRRSGGRLSYKFEQLELLFFADTTTT